MVRSLRHHFQSMSICHLQIGQAVEQVSTPLSIALVQPMLVELTNVQVVPTRGKLGSESSSEQPEKTINNNNIATVICVSFFILINI